MEKDKPKTYLEDSILDGPFEPKKQHGDQKWQATDFMWSKTTYRLDGVIKDPGNCILYHLQDGPERVFGHNGYKDTSVIL